MLKSFSATMVAATSILTLVRAQLPHECFLVTEMIHVLGNPDSEYTSDLPALITGYQPGMQISKIRAYQDHDYEDLLTGLRTTLYNHKTHEHVDYPVVGFVPDEWDDTVVSELVEDPLDRISIIKNNEGICDVVLW